MKTRKQARTAKAKLLGHKRRSKGIRAKKLWLKVDRLATQASNFKSPDSRIMLDGREVLFGQDWYLRRCEVYARDRGVCQLCKGYVSFELFDADHIVPRSKGRDDRLPNLRLVHSMADFRHDCHRLRHGRYPRFSKVTVSEGSA